MAVEDKIAKRIDELIEKGDKVLATAHREVLLSRPLLIQGRL